MHLDGDMTISIAYRVDDDEVAWRVTDGEAVLLHADSSAYFGLNRTATLLWERVVRQPATLEQLTEWSRSVFPDTPDALMVELSDFLEGLAELGLLHGESVESPIPAVPPARGSDPWESPTLERFGELEKLILSGE